MRHVNETCHTGPSRLIVRAAGCTAADSCCRSRNFITSHLTFRHLPISVANDFPRAWSVHGTGSDDGSIPPKVPSVAVVLSGTKIWSERSRFSSLSHFARLSDGLKRGGRKQSHEAARPRHFLLGFGSTFQPCISACRDAVGHEPITPLRNFPLEHCPADGPSALLDGCRSTFWPAS